MEQIELYDLDESSDLEQYSLSFSEVIDNVEMLVSNVGDSHSEVISC